MKRFSRLPPPLVSSGLTSAVVLGAIGWTLRPRLQDMEMQFTLGNMPIVIVKEGGNDGEESD